MKNKVCDDCGKKLKSMEHLISHECNWNKMTSKPIKAWACFDEDGQIFCFTIKFSPIRSIQVLENEIGDNWRALKKDGYTCQEIIITKKKKGNR